jgi:hypothetical protein
MDDPKAAQEIFHSQRLPKNVVKIYEGNAGYA